MMMNLLFGLPTMVLCLVLRSLLVVAALPYYDRREARAGNPSLRL